MPETKSGLWYKTFWFFISFINVAKITSIVWHHELPSKGSFRARMNWCVLNMELCTSDWYFLWGCLQSNLCKPWSVPKLPLRCKHLTITEFKQNFAMVNRLWPTAVAGKADNVSSVSASACLIGGPNSVNPCQILLVYGISYLGAKHDFERY